MADKDTAMEIAKEIRAKHFEICGEHAESLTVCEYAEVIRKMLPPSVVIAKSDVDLLNKLLWMLDCRGCLDVPFKDGKVDEEEWLPLHRDLESVIAAYREGIGRKVRRSAQEGLTGYYAPDAERKCGGKE